MCNLISNKQVEDKELKGEKLVKITVILVLSILVCCVCIYLGMHYLQTYSISNVNEVKKAATIPLSHISENGDNYQHKETVYKDSFAASLLYDEEAKKYCVAVFRRDSVWKNRYEYVGGCFDGNYGEMISSNTSYKETGIIAVGGYGLPKEAEYYSITNSGITYSCDIEDETVLRIFITENPNDINGAPEMFNDKNENIG